MSNADSWRGSDRVPVDPWQQFLTRPTDLDLLQYTDNPPSSPISAGLNRSSNLARGQLFQPLVSDRANLFPVKGWTVADATTTGPAAVLRSGPLEQPRAGISSFLSRAGDAPIGNSHPPGPRLPGRIPGALGALLTIIQALDDLVEKPQRVFPPQPEPNPNTEPERGMSSDKDDDTPKAQRPDPNIRRLTTVEKSPPLAPETEAGGENYEGCDDEWAEARKTCEDGFRGPRGYGPQSRPLGRREWSLNDCIESLVSARCGGKPLKEGLSGKERAKRNNEAVQKKRRDRESRDDAPE